MNVLKILILSLFVFCSVNVSAMEEYGTYLCAHKYDKERKHYYCEEKVSKVVLEISADKFYFKDKFDYIEYFRESFLKKLDDINNDVNHFKYAIADQSRGSNKTPEKNDFFYYFHFSKPDWEDKKIRINVYVSFRNKYEIYNIEYDFQSKNDFYPQFKKIVDSKFNGILKDLYSK